MSARSRSTTSIPRAVPSLAQERRARLARRVGLVGFAVFVLLGASGQLGIRSVTDHAASGDLEVALRRAQVARPALAVPYELRIVRPGGFEGSIEVRVSTAYLEVLDENGSHPEPATSSTDGEDTIWTFDPPEGEELVVWLDTRIEPGAQWRRDGRTTVTNEGDRVELEHPIWIAP